MIHVLNILSETVERPTDRSAFHGTDDFNLPDKVEIKDDNNP